MEIEYDSGVFVWSDSPKRAAEFFGYTYDDVTVVVHDRSDNCGRVLYEVRV